MTENAETGHIVMVKGVRLNMYDDQLYYPSAEQTTKGKHKGKIRFNWNGKFILPPKDSPEGKAIFDQLKKAMAVAKKNTWKDDADDIKIKLANTPLQDGDDEEITTFQPMKGAYFLSASKTVYGAKDGDESDVPKRPFRIIGPRKVKNANGELKFPDMELGEEGAPYSGCIVNVKVELWGQKADGDRQIPNRINATILAVQFARHGDAFGGGGARVNVDTEFDEEGDGDDFDTGSSSSSNDDDDLGI